MRSHARLFGPLVAVALLAAGVGQAAAPVRLHLAWDGAPCNARGAVVVSLTNVGAGPLAVPRVAGLGYGALLIARVNVSGRATGSVGDGFMTPHAALNGGSIVVLRPGEHRDYPLELADPPGRGPMTPFDDAYARLRATGGKVGVFYALNPAMTWPTDDPRLYRVNEKLDPAIDSNPLACPAPPRLLP